MGLDTGLCYRCLDTNSFLPAWTQHRRDALTLQKRGTGPGNPVAGMQACMNHQQRRCMLLTVSQSTATGLLFSLLVFARFELCFPCCFVSGTRLCSYYCVCCCLTICMLCLLLLSSGELLASMKPAALSSLSFIPSMLKQKKLELLV